MVKLFLAVSASTLITIGAIALLPEAMTVKILLYLLLAPFVDMTFW